MSNTPIVSVIVPNYNHAVFLPRRIESIFNQTYQDFELILLDDCSTDDSRSVLLRCAGDTRVRIEFNETNSGTPFRQWNKGVKLARGEYVWIAESDDYADERFLERLVGQLEADERIMYAYCRSWRVDEDDRVHGFVEPYLDAPDLSRWTKDFHADGTLECSRYLVRTNPSANASAIVFRKDSYEAVGGADERLRLCGDWKLWAAMALHGEIAYLSEPLNYYRFHRESVRAATLDNGCGIAEAIAVVRWIMTQVAPDEMVRRQFCEVACELWIPALLSSGVPFGRKMQIMRDIRVVDRCAFRRLARPLWLAVRHRVASRVRGRTLRPGDCQ